MNKKIIKEGGQNKSSIPSVFIYNYMDPEYLIYYLENLELKKRRESFLETQFKLGSWLEKQLQIIEANVATSKKRLDIIYFQFLGQFIERSKGTILSFDCLHKGWAEIAGWRGVWHSINLRVKQIRKNIREELKKEEPAPLCGLFLEIESWGGLTKGQLATIVKYRNKVLTVSQHISNIETLINNSFYDTALHYLESAAVIGKYCRSYHSDKYKKYCHLAHGAFPTHTLECLVKLSKKDSRKLSSINLIGLLIIDTHDLQQGPTFGTYSLEDYRDCYGYCIDGREVGIRRGVLKGNPSESLWRWFKVGTDLQTLFKGIFFKTTEVPLLEEEIFKVLKPYAAYTSDLIGL